MLTDKALIAVLQSNMVETGSLMCLGCGHEHNCSTQGCAILREAAERLKERQWVPASERLPKEPDTAVLVTAYGKPCETITLEGSYEFAVYSPTEGWILDEYPEWELARVTHWMPLPRGPWEENG